MPIIHSSAQKSKSLREFFTEVSRENNFPSPVIGRSMLLFIEMIDQTFINTVLWGLTSHYRLVVLSQDDWKSDWYVIVTGTGDGGYNFEYLLPADKRPWEGAMVSGFARDLTTARRFLLIAMSESKGWKDNIELKELMDAYKD